MLVLGVAAATEANARSMIGSPRTRRILSAAIRIPRRDSVYAARPVIHLAPPREAECRAPGRSRADRGVAGPPRDRPPRLTGRYAVNTLIGAVAMLASGRYAIFHAGVEV